MIMRLELKNFTAFTDLTLDFSPKINIIIGENSTGKTHLLKAAYGLCNDNGYSGMNELKKSLTSRLLKLFMPADNKLGKMHHRGAPCHASLTAAFRDGCYVSASFFSKSRSLVDLSRSNDGQDGDSAAPVFIPAKEVLSFMKGFTSLYEKFGLSIDQTYQDICLLLDLPELRPEKLHKKSKWVIEEIERICGGRFIFSGGGKVTFRAGNIEYSANAAAEGFRKAGILSRLLETGSIQPGITGPLFWDEPEANLNPRLMEMLVRILLELSRNGQQIILATHDYVLLKWFDILMDKTRNDHVRFHSLYREPDTSIIKIASTDEYLKITPNSIDEAYGLLIDREIENDMQGIRP